jgi:hypothetical protein
MAVVGVLSTQLLHHCFVRDWIAGASSISLTTDVDRVLERNDLGVLR